MWAQHQIAGGMAMVICTHQASFLPMSVEALEEDFVLTRRWMSLFLYFISQCRQCLLPPSNVIFMELCDVKGLKVTPCPMSRCACEFRLTAPFSVTALQRNETSSGPYSCPLPRLLGGQSLADPHHWAAIVLHTPPEHLSWCRGNVTIKKGFSASHHRSLCSALSHPSLKRQSWAFERVVIWVWIPAPPDISPVSFWPFALVLIFSWVHQKAIQVVCWCVLVNIDARMTHANSGEYLELKILFLSLSL